MFFFLRRRRFIKLIKFLKSQLHFVFKKLHKQITTLITLNGVFLSNLCTSLITVRGYFWQVSICLRILSSLTFCPHPGQSFLSSYLLSIAILRNYTIDKGYNSCKYKLLSINFISLKLNFTPQRNIKYLKKKITITQLVKSKP